MSSLLVHVYNMSPLFEIERGNIDKNVHILLEIV